MMKFVKKSQEKDNINEKFLYILFKNQDYDQQSQESSSTSHQKGKRNAAQKHTAKNQMQSNIPSFITQVGRDGKPLQQFYEENNQENVKENQNSESFFERLCSCFKSKKQYIQEEDEESQIDQETNTAAMPSPPQQEQNQHQQQQQQTQKQRGPLQTSAPKIIKPQEPQYYSQLQSDLSSFKLYLSGNIQDEILFEKYIMNSYYRETLLLKIYLDLIELFSYKNNILQFKKYFSFIYLIGKKSLVIDLDETLVHSSFTVIQNADFTLQITVQNMPFIVYVKKRPGCEFFLEELSKYYELIIYTASLSEYADPVMDRIDKNKVCSLRLFRENCTLYNGIFVKDMSLMNRDLKDVIIIDNSETSFLFQPANAVHIKSFFDDMKDRELYRLIPVLIFLSNNYDVRHVGNWWKEFEQNDYIDYRDKKNRLQRLDKLKMLEELGDLRQRDLQIEAESMYDNSSHIMLNKGRESFSISPKGNQQILYNQNQRRNSGDDRNDKYKKNQAKKPLMIEVPETDETDNLPASRINANMSSNQELESYTDQPTSAKGSAKGFRFNEYEDQIKCIKEEDPYSFKTQPDILEEDSESYKEMKQIFDNIRYSYNHQNINSPVSKERFVALLDSNSYKKNTSKHSQQDQEKHFFTSVKKQQNEIQNAQNIKNESEEANNQPESNEDDIEELTNKDSDDITIINKEEQEASTYGTN